MKELRGFAEVNVPASPERCLELLKAVEAYPSWYPEVVKRVEVLQRDASGLATEVQTELHLAQGPLARDFEVRMSVGVQPSTVSLIRVPHEPDDEERFEVVWKLVPGAQTRISLELVANLPVPRLVPLGGIGDSVARGFADAAARQLA